VNVGRRRRVAQGKAGYEGEREEGRRRKEEGMEEREGRKARRKDISST